MTNINSIKVGDIFTELNGDHFFEVVKVNPKSVKVIEKRAANTLVRVTTDDPADFIIWDYFGEAVTVNDEPQTKMLKRTGTHLPETINGGYWGDMGLYTAEDYAKDKKAAEMLEKESAENFKKNGRGVVSWSRIWAIMEETTNEESAKNGKTVCRGVIWFPFFDITAEAKN